MNRISIGEVLFFNKNDDISQITRKCEEENIGFYYDGSLSIIVNDKEINMNDLKGSSSKENEDYIAIFIDRTDKKSNMIMKKVTLQEYFKIRKQGIVMDHNNPPF